MKILIIVIWTALLTWWLLHTFVYSHQAKIKRLWEEIFRLSRVIKKWEMQDDSVAEYVIGMVSRINAKKKRIGNLINAILDYHYTDTKNEYEQQYVHGNRYEVKK